MDEQEVFAEAQRAMLALVGVDVDGLTETLFQFGAFGGAVDLAGVIEMLREIGDEKFADSDVQRFRIFKRRGHQIATMVLVVQDVDAHWDPEQEATITRARICVGSAMCRRNGKPSPGSAWPNELRGWSHISEWNNRSRAQWWLQRAGRGGREDRVVFGRQYLPQMIAALEAAAEEQA